MSAPTHGRMALRAAGCRQSLPTSTYTRKAPTSALRMQVNHEHPAIMVGPAPE